MTMFGLEKFFKNFFLILIVLNISLLHLFSKSGYCESNMEQNGSTESEATIQPIPEGEQLLEIPFEELMKINVTVASLFPESNLDSGSSVEAFRPLDWKKIGVRRAFSVLEQKPGIVVYDNA